MKFIVAFLCAWFGLMPDDVPPPRLVCSVVEVHTDGKWDCPRVKVWYERREARRAGRGTDAGKGGKDAPAGKDIPETFGDNSAPADEAAFSARSSDEPTDAGDTDSSSEPPVDGISNGF